MSRATDIITYIGIPLAVLGVIPLLWNMIKSFIIRRRLVALIPASLRQNYVLIMDPVAGIVSMSIQHLIIDASSILGYDRVSPDPASNVETLPLEEWDEITYDESTNDNSRKPQTRTGQYAKSIIIQSTSNPSASWMPIVNAGLKPMRDTKTGPQTFSVDSSLSCGPTILKCAWPTFVYFTAALGLDVISKANVEHLIKLKGQLEMRSTLPTPTSFRSLSRKKLFDVMPAALGNIGMFETSMIAFSIKRLLAWENIMTPDPHDPTLCIILPSREQFRLTDIVAFSGHGLVRWQRDSNGDQKLAPLAREKYRLDTTGSRWRAETFSDALTWAIYAEQVFAREQIALPCSQVFLLFQEQSLIWLGRMDVTERSKRLAELLKSDMVREVEGFLRDEWESHTFPLDKLANASRDLSDLPLLADADRMRQLIQRGGQTGWRYGGVELSVSRHEAPPRSALEQSTPKILKPVQNHDAYKTVLSKFNPTIGKRTESDATLEPGSLVEFLAHLLLATSVIRATPRAEWYLHWQDVEDDGWMNCRVVPEHPLKTILETNRHPLDSMYFI